MKASLYGIDLILPGDPRFLPTLYGQIPPGQSSTGAYIVRSETGLMAPASPQELWEYLEGGEYDEVVGDENRDGYLEEE